MPTFFESMYRYSTAQLITLCAALGCFLMFYHVNKRGRHNQGLDPDIYTLQRENSSAERTPISQLKILCLINHKAGNEDKAKAVTETWVKRCDDYAFISTQQRAGSPTVVLNRTESRQILWPKVQALLRYANSRRNEFDWFLKTDDDTYIIMENLKHFLSHRSTNEPAYIGTEFKKMKPEHPPSGFLSGGAGYVFSRRAVQLIVEAGFDTNKCDLADHEVEEVRLEECARKAGVNHDGRTRDRLQRGRFFPYAPARHFAPGSESLDGWLRYPMAGHHLQCCSDSAISFHYITPINMYILEYFVYILRPYNAKEKYRIPA